MIDLRRWSRRTGLDKETLEQIWGEAEEVAISVFGDADNEEYVIDTFKDLLKKRKYREGKVKDPIAQYLENKDTEIDVLFQESKKIENKKVGNIKITKYPSDEYKGMKTHYFELNGSDKGFNFDEAQFEYTPAEGELTKFGQSCKEPEKSFVMGLLGEAFPNKIKK